MDLLNSMIKLILTEHWGKMVQFFWVNGSPFNTQKLVKPNPVQMAVSVVVILGIGLETVQ